MSPSASRCRESPCFPHGDAYDLHRVRRPAPSTPLLHKVADFYEDECETTVKSLTTIIEPIMMLFIGGIVGVIVISMYLPMFNMMNLVN